MKIRRSAAFGAVFSAVLVFGGGAGLAAQATKAIPSAVPAKTAVVPATETILAAPATPALAVQPVQAQAQPEQRAGMSKPIKVYWYLSGR